MVVRKVWKFGETFAINNSDMEDPPGVKCGLNAWIIHICANANANANQMRMRMRAYIALLLDQLNQVEHVCMPWPADGCCRSVPVHGFKKLLLAVASGLCPQRARARVG